MGQAVLNPSSMRSASHPPHEGWRVRWRRGPTALAALAALVVSSAAPAWASCLLPEPRIIWSYPAQGATDVPTNTDLWLLPSGWSPARVSRGGKELPQLELQYGYDLGELPRNTQIRLQVQVGGQTLELSFTTGRGRAAASSCAAPGNVTPTSSLEYAASAQCEDALSTQDCFDTGQSTYYEFAPTGRAVGWVIASRDSSFDSIDLWPGECGAPRLFRNESNPPCVVLYGIDASGATHAGQEVCAAGAALTDAGAPPDAGASGTVLGPAAASCDEPGEITTSSSGCTLGPTPNAGSPPWALALLGLFGGWRAARSRRRGTQ